MSKPEALTRSVWWTFPTLIVFLLMLSACSAGATSDPLPTQTPPLTSTPFQPETTAPDPLFGLPVDALPAATITPMPTLAVQPNGQAPAYVVPPTLDASGQLPYEINPLTGLPFPNPALAERRPMAIKIANSPDYIRPQSGLSLSDVAYEYYIEWGDTRFIAVFYSNDSTQVGPVRSGRFFDEHVLRMYHAFLVYKYSDPREKEYFYSSDFAPFLTVPGFTSCPPFFTGLYARDNYNNVFFNTTKMDACVARRSDVDNLRQDLRHGFFSDDSPATDQSGVRVFTDYSIYSYNYWEYDAATRRYFRYQESADMVKTQPRAYAPMYDAVTGLPVTADNVVVIFVSHTFANQFEEEDEVYRIDPVGEGLAFVFRDGKAYPARWYRMDMDQALFIADEQGMPIYLHPGRTFYQVIGESSQYTHDGDNWYFTFKTP